MDRLGSRIRDILRQGSRPTVSPEDAPPAPASPAVGQPSEAPGALAASLGGLFRGAAAGACFVVEREYPADALHGAVRVGDCAASSVQSIAHAGILAQGLSGAPEAPVPLLFFDLETTGLSGGAGTHAFLVGCGFFDDGAFRTRQFFLTSYAAERALLVELATLLARIGLLVTFNGKSFDLPVIETRYLFHRLTLPDSTRAHLDMLHPARHFWRRRDGGAGAARTAAGSYRDVDRDADDRCTLGALERSVLGFRRHGDIPGSEIPSRYFHYVRTGEVGPLEPVFEHNRLDLLSLAALTARGLQLAAAGPPAAASPRECLALGRMYERAGRLEAATACYDRVDEWAADSHGRDGVFVRADALRRLALLHRRARRYGEAARMWERLVGWPDCPSAIVREAAEALAVHHEHRSKDLTIARQYARRCLGETAPRAASDARRRLARVERKLAAREPAALLLQSPDG